MGFMGITLLKISENYCFFKTIEVLISGHNFQVMDPGCRKDHTVDGSHTITLFLLYDPDRASRDRYLHRPESLQHE
jgi:hypothetical protein